MAFVANAVSLLAGVLGAIRLWRPALFRELLTEVS